MQKLNSRNTESRFIKNILSNSYVPNIPILIEDDYAIEGCTYLYGNDVVTCTKSGKIGDTLPSICSKFLKCSTDVVCSHGTDSASFSHVCQYSMNKHIQGINYRFISGSSDYDKDTHRQLGELLRCIRSLTDINLMPLYNCFTGESASSMSIKTSTSGELYLSDYADATSKMWLVPIKFNRKYTLFIDSKYPIYLKSVVVDKSGRIRDGDTYLDDRIDERISTVSGMQFTNPHVYKVNCRDGNLIPFEKNLYLAIQTSSNHDGSIVVVEGDMRSRANNSIINAESIDTITYSDYHPTVIPSLGTMDSKNNIAYSDRLIEYLLFNVVSSCEDIPLNIKRVKDVILGDSRENKDIWTDDMVKSILSSYYKKVSSLKFDTDEMGDNYTPKDYKSRFSSLDTDKLVFSNNVLVGTKNIQLLNKKYAYNKDILGYVDKDIESSIYKYRGE